MCLAAGDTEWWGAILHFFFFLAHNQNWCNSKKGRRKYPTCFLFVRAAARLMCHQICGEESQRIMFWIVSLTILTVCIWIWSTLAGFREGLHVGIGGWSKEVEKKIKRERVNSRDFFSFKSSSIYTITLIVRKAIKIGRMLQAFNGWKP